jgi:hypothetical protein
MESDINTRKVVEVRVPSTDAHINPEKIAIMDEFNV